MELMTVTRHVVSHRLPPKPWSYHLADWTAWRVPIEARSLEGHAVSEHASVGDLTSIPVQTSRQR
jgi:hypothetical protein